MSEFKSTYRHNVTNALVKTKNLGMGEKKLQHEDGSETKISNGVLARDYTFHSSDEKRVGNISKRMKNRIVKTKRIV